MGSHCTHRERFFIPSRRPLNKPLIVSNNFPGYLKERPAAEAPSAERSEAERSEAESRRAKRGSTGGSTEAARRSSGGVAITKKLKKVPPESPGEPLIF